MNYPIWDLTTIGGGSLIALIAILHVLISHFAVGGGFFLWMTDRRAVASKDIRLVEYVKKHVWFFLLLTLVAGGMTGVGIWFIISLVHPAATSTLIHNFVFGWAIEWVFFVVEICALLIYHYRFDVLTERNRLRVAFIYFLFAWLSLAIINGILSFMLTPGKWLETHGFWEGFLNPTYPASLFFRTFLALTLAGIFGYITAVRIRDDAFRQRLIFYCSKWLVVPVAGLLPSAVWYYFSLPVETRRTGFLLNPQTVPFEGIFLGTSAVLLLTGVLMMRRWSLAIQRIATGLLLIIALGWIGSFEYVRELARKPFVIEQYMYDSSIRVDQISDLQRDGVLPHALWSAVRGVTEANRAEAGRELFRLECQCCHTLHGIRNDIAVRVRNFTYLGILANLTGQGKMLNYMPPFVGTEKEKGALAYYLATAVNGEDVAGTVEVHIPALMNEPIPPFDNASSDYVLLAWNDLGMHCISDGDAWFSFLPPANTIEAQLIKRGNPPVLMGANVTISYAVEEGFTNPARHSEFWNHAPSLFGVALERNMGLFGKGVTGTMDYDSTRNGFIARGIPIVPYNDDGTYNPYPIVLVEARDSATGAILASTKAVAPVSAEIGCRNCHAGGWRYRGAGLSDETASNILRLHDRINGTALLTLAREGKPQLCQSCHPDPVLNAAGKPGIIDFSTAMHAWHALYMPFEDARSCGLCHPSAPTGATRCLRDPHSSLGLTCLDCHGNMREDALSLLKGESAKEPAQRLAAQLAQTTMAATTPRVPWNQQNDCLNCHREYRKPENSVSGFGTWTSGAPTLYKNRDDMAGLRCPACHGSTHAVYPSHNFYNRDRDNIQPLQYSGSRAPLGTNKTCAICHRQSMQDAIHHPNMESPFRHTELLQ